jgi:HAD superfamily hydrolase (TIGR01509 family)
VPAAVIFDLDGVLIDSERAWESARRNLALRAGGRWADDAQARMMGMSSPEWTRWMHDELGVELEPDQIFEAVTEELSAAYRDRLPLLPGAAAAVERLAGRWPLAMASSSSRILIDLVLELGDLARHFKASVSSEEVDRGKPAPDVYLEAARKLAVEPAACVAIEDSTNGIRAGAAAGMKVIAIPERDFPPSPEALEEAAAEIGSLDELTPELVDGLAGEGAGG